MLYLFLSEPKVLHHYNRALLVLDCQYGDKSGWCRTIAKSDCYTRSTRQSCCETCAKAETGLKGKPVLGAICEVRGVSEVRGIHNYTRQM